MTSTPNPPDCTCASPPPGHTLRCAYGQWLATLTPTEEEAHERITALERHVQILTTIRDANSTRLAYYRDRYLDAVESARRESTARLKTLNDQTRSNAQVTLKLLAVHYELEQLNTPNETILQLLRDAQKLVTT